MLLLLTGVVSAGTAMDARAAAYRVNEAAGFPDWLSVSGTQRTRFENLDGRFRRGRTGGDQMLALRTIVLAELQTEPLTFGVELIDSRAVFDDSGTPINTTMVNPAELLQGYIAWHRNGLFSASDNTVIRAGRLTLDVGSRRYVARSKYRNTINTFTGVELNWNNGHGQRLQAFYTLPVNRKPDDPGSLIDNDIEFDEEDSKVRFWGLLLASDALFADVRGEVFLFGIDEHDVPGRASRNRDFVMPGLRIYRPKGTERVDWLIESAVQVGESRASSAATDRRDLDHLAYNVRVELGYTWVHRWKPRLNFEFDIASGDDDPNDGDHGRFDTLFGARRLDFGPTGIYGAFARSNLVSPGLRLNLKPSPRTQLMACYRGFWLESRRDGWTTSGLRDASGTSGRFVAQQVEARARYALIPGNVDLEFGVTAAFDGRFMREAPGSPAEGDLFYSYGHVRFTF